MAAGIFLQRETDENASTTNVLDALIFTIHLASLVILTLHKLSFDQLSCLGEFTLLVIHLLVSYKESNVVLQIWGTTCLQPADFPWSK